MAVTLIELESRLDSLEGRVSGFSGSSPAEMYQWFERGVQYTGESDSLLAASFICKGTDALKFSIATGKVYIAGVSKSITDFPNSDVTVSSPSSHKWHGYIEVDLTGGTASWKTGGADPGDGDDDTEIWPIVEITLNDGDTAISEIKQRWLGDIHITRTA